MDCYQIIHEWVKLIFFGIEDFRNIFHNYDIFLNYLNYEIIIKS